MDKTNHKEKMKTSVMEYFDMVGDFLGDFKKSCEKLRVMTEEHKLPVTTLIGFELRFDRLWEEYEKNVARAKEHLEEGCDGIYQVNLLINQTALIHSDVMNANMSIRRVILTRMEQQEKEQLMNIKMIGAILSIIVLSVIGWYFL